MKSLIAALFLFVSSLFGSQDTVTLHTPANPWHAAGTSTSAAVFNAAVGAQQSTISAATSAPSESGRQVPVTKPQASPTTDIHTARSAAPGASILTPPAASPYVTQAELIRPRSPSTATTLP
jgi:hypothetical protein